MKKWKRILKISIAFLIVFICIIIINAIICYTSNQAYPYPALGIDVSSWIDQFTINTTFILYILGIPLITDIILIFVSIMKINKLKKIEHN